MSNKNKSRVGDDDGGFRVTIAAHARPLIQSIRETTGKQHSDEEIYYVLQDCSMDPNETAQKLLYLDTFHEVKKKRDRKKEGQGARGVRGIYYSNHSSSVAGSGRNAPSRRENGVNHLTERGAVVRKTKNNSVPHETKASTAVPNGPSSLSNGSSNNGCDPQLTVDVVPEPENSMSVVAKKLETEPLLHTPTLASIIGVPQEKSTSSYNHLPTSSSPSSLSGVYSSASDPVLASPMSRNAGAVGTIVREVGSNRKDAEPNHIQGNKDVSYDVDKESSKGEKKASNTPNSIHKKKIDSKSEEVEKNQLFEPLQSSSLSTQDRTLATCSSVNDSLPAEESVAPPKVIASGDATVAIKANSQLLPESTVSDNQHVTFPNHFKISEAVKNGLTFGSIDPYYGLATKHVNGTSAEINSVASIESTHGSDEIAGESSARSQSIPSTTQRETLDHHHPQTPPLVDKVPSTVFNVPNGTELKLDKSKQEMPLLSEGQQKLAVLSVPNYSYGFVLPSPGSQLVQMEGIEAQTRDASLIPTFANGNSLAPSSSPAPSMQSSVAAPPQPVQIFRHPYPSSLSYGQYLSPYFMPHMHQFLGPIGLHQQPSTGNIYLSSAAAAAGVKFPLSQFKPGTNAGNPPHIGIASGYGSFSSSPVGFNLITAGTSGKSTSNEDLAASQLKDNHIYTRPLSDGSGVWIPAPGQDLSNMQLNPLYNLTLQGQHIAFAPQTGHGAFPGVYQPPQTRPAPSNANPLLQQTQAMTAAVDTMGPPSGAYQQPQLAQMNWNPSY